MTVGYIVNNEGNIVPLRVNSDGALLMGVADSGGTSTSYGHVKDLLFGLNSDGMKVPLRANSSGELVISNG